MSESRFATLSEVRLHYREEGEGDTLVLLHDWLQTSYAWRRVIPLLSMRWRVIAPDLRGLGDSSRPADGFDIGTLAGDVLELLDRLGETSFSVVGHGHGGAIGIAMALLARHRVMRLVLVDAMVPGYGGAHGHALSSAGRWHADFHRTLNLPEALVAGREAIYLGHLYEAWSERGGAVGSADLAEYVRCYQQPGAMRCGFEYDRNYDVSAAFLQTHLEWDGKLSIPVLSVAGQSRVGQAEDNISRLTSDLQTRVIPDCGHLVPEEAPTELCDILKMFL